MILGTGLRLSVACSTPAAGECRRIAGLEQTAFGPQLGREAVQCDKRKKKE